jgi:trimethylamine--corrinoid protein Co-methyltransferase
VVNLQILTQDGCEQIYRDALDVLQTTGFRVDDEEIYNLLLRCGAKAGGTPNSARLPAQMVEERLKICPSQIRIGSRSGQARTLGPGCGTEFWTGNALHIAEGRERRELLSADLARLARVVEALPNIDGMVGTSIGEFPAACRDFVGFQVMARHTRKHLRPCIFTPLGATAIIEEAQVLAGGSTLAEHPVVSFGYSIVSPLHWSATALKVMRNTSGKKIPFMINSEPMGGGTAPVTLAGCLVSGLAEALSGMVVAQLLEEGRPIVLNLGFAHVMDMSTALALTGSPENALLQAAGAEVCRFLNLPSAAWASTESMLADGQAAFEKTMTAMAHAEAGVNIVWGMGNLESTLSMSPEMLVIDDELVGAIKHFAGGIPVDREHLALETIQTVGLQGDFLSSEHTLAHYRRSIRFSKLITRSKRAVWDERGKKSLEEKAREQVEKILSRPAEEIVDADQERELDRIVGFYMERAAQA